jgi:hypothetical protein
VSPIDSKGTEALGLAPGSLLKALRATVMPWKEIGPPKFLKNLHQPNEKRSIKARKFFKAHRENQFPRDAK